MKIARSSEAGSVLYWIFIAIALFAALSFTVSRINRTGTTKMSERARLYGSDLMQYAGAVQQGVKVMRINGVDDSELCFHTSGWGHTDYQFNPQCTVNANLVFNTNGGAVSFQNTVEQWYSPTATAPANANRDWVFSARYEITNVGTDSGGAATVAANADLLMATAPIRDDICEQINLLLGYSSSTPPSVTNGTYNTMALNKFAGSFADDTGRISDLGRERCVTDGAGYNFYYKVILAR